MLCISSGIHIYIYTYDYFNDQFTPLRKSDWFHTHVAQMQGIPSRGQSAACTAFPQVL